MNYQNTLEFARQADQQDPLAHFRERFLIPQVNGKDAVYFTGNSLGLQPKTVRSYILQELDDWAEFGVEGHFHAKNPWFSYHEIFPEKVSKIVGALPEEVVVMNQLTVNLHLLMVSFTDQRHNASRSFAKPKHFLPISMHWKHNLNSTAIL